MTDTPDLTLNPRNRRALWCSVALGAAGTALAAVRVAYGAGFPDPAAAVGLLLTVLGLVCLYAASARVSADARGLRSRTLLRRRDMPWSDVADLRTYVQYGRNQEIHRVSVLLRDGRTRRLPLPISASSGDRAAFDAKLDALRALHRRHGSPESSHAPVLTYCTAGRGSAVSWILCVLLLAGAGLAAWFVPVATSEERAWAASVPCAAGTPSSERGECRSSTSAVIAESEAA